jgi:hypothetical protein
VRPPRRILATPTLIAALAVAAPGCGAAGPGARGPPAARAAGEAFAVPGMLPPARCRGLPVREAPAIDGLHDLGIFRRAQREADLVPPPQGNAITWLPVTTFDPAETRLAGAGTLPTSVHLVPTLGIPAGDRCGTDGGPGVCLVGGGPEFRCFARADVDAGRALALTGGGIVVGVVPDGTARVELSAGAASAAAEVVENVFAAPLDVAAGAVIAVTMVPVPPCVRSVSPRLRAGVTALEREPGSRGDLPAAARDVLREWGWQLDAVVEAGARRWGGGDGVEYWAVPVVPRGDEGCAPASRVCIVAVPEHARADAQCVLDEPPDATSWRLTPLLPTRAAIYGIVPDGVTGARVTIGGRSAEVEARDNVIAGVLPFPYEDESDTRVVLAGADPF